MRNHSKKALLVAVGAHLLTLLVLGCVGIFPLPAQAGKEY